MAQQSHEEFIERRILIGLATSTDYAREAARVWRPELLGSPTVRTIAAWCLDHYAKYERAPGRELETIFSRHVDSLPRDEAADVGEMLEGLSDEFERDPPDAKVLLDDTVKHFRQQNVRAVADAISQAGDVDEAERIAAGFVPFRRDEITWVDPFGDFSTIRSAFRARGRPLVRFGKTLGRFWDEQFVRDALVALLAAEKKGKSWLLLEIALRGQNQGHNVAFFQAGDMSEAQQLIRIYTRISGRPPPLQLDPDDEDDSDPEWRSPTFVWSPVLDCLKNQLDRCDRAEREENPEPLFDQEEYNEAKGNEKLGELYRDRSTREWTPCRNCPALEAAPFLRQVRRPRSLDVRQAFRAARRWQRKLKKRFRLSTHANETLSVSLISSLLDQWEREDGFKADVVVIDYADILSPDPDLSRMDSRHQINKTWQRLRRLSEEKHCLVITATQAAASAYDKKILKLGDFSEDKRKYAHVTAMYGLNQTSEEKALGILRLNQMVVREGEFSNRNQVNVLQCLPLGRPIVGSW